MNISFGDILFTLQYKMFIFQVIEYGDNVTFFSGKHGIQFRYSYIHSPFLVYKLDIFFFQAFYKVLSIGPFLWRVCGCLIAIFW